MSSFPRTAIENVSVSRMLIGINWFLGWSHTSKAKDDFIKAYQTRERLADIITVFMKAGIDTLYGIRPETEPLLLAAIQDAEQATGRKCISVATPHFPIDDSPESLDETRRIFDEHAAIGSTFCLPHQCVTDALLNRRKRCFDKMPDYCRLIRERGMIPGLSTHMPEAPVYADESGLDVGTYIQIYNPVGFLMQIEVDWVHRMIWNCRKPVICIKPMAAGRVLPLVGMSFAWATIRPQDMVCVGTMTADEARELIDISHSILDGRSTQIQLQRTRSKESVEIKKK